MHHCVAFCAFGVSFQFFSVNHWQQVSTDDNAPPDNIELTILQPKAEVYYRTCGAFDLHHQDNKMEKKLETKKWDMHVNLTIFLWIHGCAIHRAQTNTQETQSNFYVHLAEELIDNNINSSPSNAARNCQRDSRDADNLPVLAWNG